MTVYLLCILSSILELYIHILEKKCLFHGLQLINNVVPFLEWNLQRFFFAHIMYIKEFQDSAVNAI